MKARIIITALFLGIGLNLSAQEGYTAKQDTIKSEVLKQKRIISILLPERYSDKNLKFPVIYVLDADGRLQHTAMTARFLLQNNKMPGAIIVGVFNIDRNHDFLPDSSMASPTGGGADNFMKFFKKELIPYIDRNYRSEPYKVLVGHSFGGVFAMDALLTDPDLFDAYIAIDPSFWYKNQMLVKEAAVEFLKTKNWNKSVFVTGREGGGMADMAITPMEEVLKNNAPKGLNWKVVSYAGEDHGSVPFKSVYDGFRFIFDNGSNFMVFPLSAILPEGESTYAIIQNLNPNLRYTLDGTEPTINSAVCTELIRIDHPCTLKVKSVSTAYNTQPSVTRVFSEGKYLDGVKSISHMNPGLKYSYYEGVWDSLPDFSKLTPVKTGITDNLDLKFALKKDSFAVQFEGYIHITQKQLCDLWIVSDDGSKLYLNNELLLSNDGLHDAGTPVAKLLPLNPGYYPVKIQYFEKTGDQSVTIGSVTFNKRANPVPFLKEVFFYKK
jgi:predicted alpha/beta superfamily hydrolase